MGNHPVRILASRWLSAWAWARCSVLVVAMSTWDSQASGSGWVSPAGNIETQDAHLAALLALNASSWEPECTEVVEVALLFMAPPAAYRLSPGRMRLAALLPRVRFTVQKSFEHDESLDSDTSGDTKIGIDTDDDLELRGYLEWDLSNLVFNPSETGAASRRLAELDWRAEVTREIVEIFHDRKKLLTLMIMGAVQDPVGLAEAQVKVQELTAMLDAFTGGWYVEELGKRQPAVTSPSSVLSP